MTPFKEGDRVKVTGNHNLKGFRNHLGTVLGKTILSEKDVYCIQFDDYIAGHDGFLEFTGKDGHCWYCPSELMEKVIEEPTDSPEKVEMPEEGDRVKITGIQDDKFFCGMTGTVIKTGSNPVSDFLVEFDDSFPGGHDGAGRGKPNQCFFFNKENVEVLRFVNNTEKETPEMSEPYKIYTFANKKEATHLIGEKVAVGDSPEQVKSGETRAVLKDIDLEEETAFPFSTRSDVNWMYIRTLTEEEQKQIDITEAEKLLEDYLYDCTVDDILEDTSSRVLKDLIKELFDKELV